MSWCAPSTPLLREFVRLGASDTAIANVLTVLFDRPFTAKAINGKRFRLGLLKGQRVWPDFAVQALRLAARRGLSHHAVAVIVSSSGFVVSASAVRQKIRRLGLGTRAPSSPTVPIMPGDFDEDAVRIGEQTTGRLCA